MNAHDPNVAVVVQVLRELGALAEHLVLVGGCSVGLLITDKARPPVRETKDVDMVTRVASLTDYYKVADDLRACGFKEDPDAAHFCRWIKGGLILDVIPSDERALGHSTNRWYPHVVSAPTPFHLPGGQLIRLISAPLFIATKLEAFADRGDGDYLRHDMEDIINVVDGRAELSGEIASTLEEVRTFIKEEFDSLVTDEHFIDALPGHFGTGSASQARKDIVFDRMRKIAGY